MARFRFLIALALLFCSAGGTRAAIVLSVTKEITEELRPADILVSYLPLAKLLGARLVHFDRENMRALIAFDFKPWFDRLKVLMQAGVLDLFQLVLFLFLHQGFKFFIIIGHVTDI